MDSDPNDYPQSAARTIVVHPPKETRRPIGFAPWPKQKKPKRKTETKECS